MRLMAFVHRSEVTFGVLRRGEACCGSFCACGLAGHTVLRRSPGSCNAEAGHAYAKKVCAECHAVERGETEILNPPSFQIVADSPGITERALAVWLRNPHPNMPDFILPQADMENVIAYIMSLKSTSR